jgi:hypothetical protein
MPGLLSRWLHIYIQAWNPMHAYIMISLSTFRLQYTTEVERRGVDLASEI